MRKSIVLMLAVILAFILTACGGSYTCMDCGKTTSKAYYDMMASKEQVMCEECARQYWMPLPYENYRVK